MAFRRTSPPARERVVIYRLGSLGDTVAALPCFHLVERTFPDAERIVLTNVPVSSKAAPLEVILREGGLIHGAVPYPIAVRNPVVLARLAVRLRRLGATTLVYLTEARVRGTAHVEARERNVRRDVAFFRLCGFKRIVGAPLDEDLASPRVGPDGVVEPESRRLARTLSELGTIDLADRSFWDLRLTSAEHAAAETALGPLSAEPFIGVNMGGKAAEKDWGEERWATLLAQLSERLPGHGLAFVGAPDDAERADRLAPSWSGTVVNLCGGLSPRESGAALSRADLFLGHDSGPLHLADAVGTPAIGIFGPFNEPELWHPQGPATRVLHRMDGLDKITPDAVAETALELVSSPALGPGATRRSP